ncbi:MAG: hypothetical protein PVG91_10120, partial [Gammaproteobacteria bacterium]
MNPIRPLPAMAGLMLAVVLAACDRGREQGSDGPALDSVAREYVVLVLAMGEHDPDYVDAYYGPDSLREEAQQRGLSLAGIRDAALGLAERAAVAPPAPDDVLLSLRGPFLEKQLRAVAARADMMLGRTFSFDQETAALYDAISAPRDQAYFDRTLAEI